MFLIFSNPEEAEDKLIEFGFYIDQNNALRKCDAELAIYGWTREGKWLVELQSGCFELLKCFLPWQVPVVEHKKGEA